MDVRSGGERAEMRAVASATARFTQLPPDAERPAATPEPPEPAVLRALPGGRVCAPQGSSSRPGTVADRLSVRTELQFDAPPDDASDLELRLNELVVFRRCDSDPIDVPAPRPDEVVNLTGQLSCGPDRVDLVRWVPDDRGTPRLVVRPAPAGRWPDIRVVAGDSSVSLWLHPGDDCGDDVLVCGLPGMYRPLFRTAGPVTIALRMLGRRADVAPITMSLSPAGTD
jgi:hypothetical protein